MNAFFLPPLTKFPKPLSPTPDKASEYRKLLGYLPKDFGFYPDFTAERFLWYMAALKALPKDDAEKRIEELLTMVELKNVRRKKLKTFSGGMLRRIGIAQTLLNNPEILVLDEPTAGLDPICKRIIHPSNRFFISVFLPYIHQFQLMHNISPFSILLNTVFT